MSEPFEQITEEVETFGFRLHGWSLGDGSLTQPNSVVVSSPYVTTGPNNSVLAAHSDPYQVVHADPDNNVYLKNYLVASWISSNETSIGGEGLARNALPVKFASGAVWIVQHETMLPSNTSVTITAKRFGAFGDNVPASEHQIVVAIPNAGNWGGNGFWQLNDVNKTGEKRIYGLAALGDFPIGWLEMTITEVSATQVDVSFSTLKTLAQSQGTLTDSWVGSGSEGFVSSLPEDLTAVDDFPDPDTWIETITYANISSPRAIGGGAYADRSTTASAGIAGQIVSMLYDGSGGIDEVTLDIEMTRDRDGAVSNYSVSSGQTVITRERRSDDQFGVTSITPTSWSGSWDYNVTDTSSMKVKLTSGATSIEYSASSIYTQAINQAHSGVWSLTPDPSEAGFFFLSDQTLTQDFTKNENIAYTVSIGPTPSTTYIPTNDHVVTTASPSHRTSFQYVPQTNIPGYIFDPNGSETDDEKRQYLLTRANSFGAAWGSVAQARRYSNSAFAVVGGFIQGGTPHAYETQTLTRTGLAGTAQTIGVTQVSGPSDLSFDAISLSVQPVTGEVLRTAGEFPFMGWV